jgi:hypothetical protein
LALWGEETRVLQLQSGGESPGYLDLIDFCFYDAVIVVVQHGQAVSPAGVFVFIILLGALLVLTLF